MMSLQLTPEIEALINKLMETGKYEDQLAIIQEGLRLVAEKERLHQERNNLPPILSNSHEISLNLVAVLDKRVSNFTEIELPEITREPIRSLPTFEE